MHGIPCTLNSLCSTATDTPPLMERYNSGCSYLALLCFQSLHFRMKLVLKYSNWQRQRENIDEFDKFDFAACKLINSLEGC